MASKLAMVKGVRWGEDTHVERLFWVCYVTSLCEVYRNCTYTDAIYTLPARHPMPITRDTTRTPNTMGQIFIKHTTYHI